MREGQKYINVPADLFSQLGGVVVTEGGGGLQHVVEHVAGEDQALLGLQPVGAGQGEGHGLSWSRLQGDLQTFRGGVMLRYYILTRSRSFGELGSF